MRLNQFICFFLASCLLTPIMSYDWPLDPTMDHEVWGTFGECRGTSTRDHLHTGIDLDNDNDNVKVVAVVDGWVHYKDISSVVIKSGSDPFWEYYTYREIANIQVNEDDHVTAGTTVLGYINSGISDHLHFVDGNYYDQNDILENPLYNLTPFTDSGVPVIDYVILTTDEDPNVAAISTITKRNKNYDIVVKAHDTITGSETLGLYSVSIEILMDGSLVDWFSGIFFGFSYTKAEMDNANFVYAPGSQGEPSTILIYKATNWVTSNLYWYISEDRKQGNYQLKATVTDESGNSVTKTTTVNLEGSPYLREESK